jgi:putative transposase
MGTDDEAEEVHRRADHRGSAEHDAGAKAADLARKHGISEATLYNWKAKYGGMDVSDAKRLRSLEEENRKLKKLLAESILDQAALKGLLAKKMVGPVAKREAVAHLRNVLVMIAAILTAEAVWPANTT